MGKSNFDINFGEGR